MKCRQPYFNNWRDVVAISWLLLLLLAAVVAHWLPLPYSPTYLDLQATTQAPGTTNHWLGTDPYGRDVAALLLFGTRTTLLLCLPTALLTTGIGALLGGAAGFWRNKPFPLDSLIMGIMVIISSVPRLVLVLTLAAVQAPSLSTIFLLLLCTHWIAPARLVRAEMLRVRELPFIMATRATGIPSGRIFWRHALPNARYPALITFPLSIASLISLETTLSFLGIGLPPDVPSWGRLMAAITLDTTAWWLLVFPGFLLLATTFSLRRLSH